MIQPITIEYSRSLRKDFNAGLAKNLITTSVAFKTINAHRLGWASSVQVSVNASIVGEIVEAYTSAGWRVELTETNSPHIVSVKVVDADA